MKYRKRIASVVLAMVMVLAMSMPVMAATVEQKDQGNSGNTKGKITVTNVTLLQEYSIYRIFDLESYNKTAEAYSYKVNKSWENFIKESYIKGVYVTVDKQGYVSWVEGAEGKAPEFAMLAIAYAKNHNIQPTEGPKKAMSTDGLVFDNLELGYYLVDSTVGTVCSLDTTNNTVDIVDKNEQPTTEKQVQEDSKKDAEGEGWGTENDAELGETVNYKATIKAKEGAQNYVFHDKMTGLTFAAVSKITVSARTLTSPGDYQVKTETDDGCSFEIVFAQTFLNTLQDDDVITIEYTATVNEDAVIRGAGNPNEEWLQFGEQGNMNTEHSRTTTFVWDFGVFKYTNGEEGAQTPLAGAVFSLSTTEDVADALKFVNDGANIYKLDTEEGTVTSFTTDATGKFSLKGLDSGTYYLIETEAPDGYNKLDGPVTVTIGEDGTITYDETKLAEGDTEVQVLNQTGSRLPETGGIGTTIFYVIGAVLVIGAGILLVVRKRMSKEQ